MSHKLGKQRQVSWSQWMQAPVLQVAMLAGCSPEPKFLLLESILQKTTSSATPSSWRHDLVSPSPVGRSAVLLAQKQAGSEVILVPTCLLQQLLFPSFYQRHQPDQQQAEFPPKMPPYSCSPNHPWLPLVADKQPRLAGWIVSLLLLTEICKYVNGHIHKNIKWVYS